MTATYNIIIIVFMGLHHKLGIMTLSVYKMCIHGIWTV